MKEFKPETVIDFWFSELKPEDWFKKSDALDQEIRTRFLDAWSSAGKGELFFWRSTPKGRLAEILILDQFSRNLHRNHASSFSQDTVALILAQDMVILGWDQEVPKEWRSFIYMPYMHSESSKIHEESVKLFTKAGLEDNLKYEMAHKEIIDRFGRYPHRNSILGRTSTTAELEFLKTHPGF